MWHFQASNAQKIAFGRASGPEPLGELTTLPQTGEGETPSPRPLSLGAFGVSISAPRLLGRLPWKFLATPMFKCTVKMCSILKLCIFLPPHVLYFITIFYSAECYCILHSYVINDFAITNTYYNWIFRIQSYCFMVQCNNVLLFKRLRYVVNFICHVQLLFTHDMFSKQCRQYIDTDRWV